MENIYSNFQRICQSIAHCSNTLELDERELVTRCFEEGFFSALDYGRVGEDIRLEQRTTRGRIDITLRAFGARPICVLEYKRPSVSLHQWIGQLQEYIEDVLPEWAILTNGKELLLFQCSTGRLLQPAIKSIQLQSITPDQAQYLYDCLKRRDVDLNSLSSVSSTLSEIKETPLHVSGPQELGGKQFVSRFRLGKYTAFGRLVGELDTVLQALSNQPGFTRGAYEFWRRVYARELTVDDIPRTWKDFVSSSRGDEVYQLMFAIETAYVLLARVLLAKAMNDAEFPNISVIEIYTSSLRLDERHGQLPAKAYINATTRLFNNVGSQAFTSLFASDIFDWWQDVEVLSDYNSLAHALAEATIAIFSFDFSNLRGDILGDLYQSYFDAETRKTLGEFYTPPEVVDFILDNIGYQGPSVTTARLLDPACGSGTFLVHALTRYLNASQGRNPVAVLRGLIHGLRIVGFDINPFAILMAQINYAVHLLPIYAGALRRDPAFEIPGIPVYRTDSLRQESREGELETGEDTGEQLAFQMEGAGDVSFIRTVLPVLREEAQFVQVLVAVPRYDRALERGLTSNVEEYFSLVQQVFKLSKEGNLSYEHIEGSLSARYGSRGPELAQFVMEAIHKNAATITQLRRQYGDGRFLKTLEDLALALVLKNDLQYDYIAGNPPYVRIQSIPEVFRRRWQRMYSWAQGNFDIYIPFIQRSLQQWLKDDGRLGFICSNRFMLVNYGAPIRENLLQEARVETLLDLRDSEVFQHALNYPVIMIYRRKQEERAYTFLAGRAFADPSEGGIRVLLKEAGDLLGNVTPVTKQKVGQYVEAFIQDSDTLEPGRWCLMPPSERHILQHLEENATHRLEQLTATEGGVFEGLSTGADEVMIFKFIREMAETLIVRPRGAGVNGIPEEIEIEKEILRKWYYGRDMERWSIPWSGWYILWPYIEINRTWKLIPNSTDVEYFPYATETNTIDYRYPLAWEYLNKTPVKEKLLNRERGRFRPGRTDGTRWYSFSARRSLGFYSRNKICILELTQKPTAAFDDSYAAFGPGICGIIPNKSNITLYLLALLNSSPLFFWMKQCSVVHGGHALKYDDRFSRNLPIKLPQNQRERDIARQLKSVVEVIFRDKADIRKFELDLHNILTPQGRRPDSQTEFYHLQDLVIGNLPVRNLRLQDVELLAQIDGYWRIRAGQQSIVLPTEDHARLMEVWIHLQEKDEIARSTLLNLLLPNTAAGCSQTIDLINRIKSDMSLIKGHLRDSEAEINRYVIDLYGLEQADLDIIKDFLRRF